MPRISTLPMLPQGKARVDQPTIRCNQLQWPGKGCSQLMQWPVLQNQLQDQVASLLLPEVGRGLQGPCQENVQLSSTSKQQVRNCLPLIAACHPAPPADMSLRGVLADHESMLMQDAISEIGGQNKLQ